MMVIIIGLYYFLNLYCGDSFRLYFFCGLLVVMARLTPPTEPIGMKSRSFSKSKNIKNYNKQCADYKAYNIIFLIFNF